MPRELIRWRRLVVDTGSLMTYESMSLRHRLYRRVGGYRGARSDPLGRSQAYIVLKYSTTPQSLMPNEIRAFCREHPSSLKVPRYLQYCMELPKTPSLKVQEDPLRAELRAPQGGCV